MTIGTNWNKPCPSVRFPDLYQQFPERCARPLGHSGPHETYGWGKGPRVQWGDEEQERSAA